AGPLDAQPRPQRGRRALGDRPGARPRPGALATLAVAPSGRASTVARVHPPSTGASMRRRARSALSYSNVVATLSLFIVLGGGAYAAKTHLIDGKLLKPGSVTGAKLKRDTLTGKQIKESTLGQVPNAAKLGGRPASAYQPAGSYLPTGGTAADAAKLGGKDPSAYLPASRIVQGSGVTSDVPADTVLTYAPLSLAVET